MEELCKVIVHKEHPEISQKTLDEMDTEQLLLNLQVSERLRDIYRLEENIDRLSTCIDASVVLAELQAIGIDKFERFVKSGKSIRLADLVVCADSSASAEVVRLLVIELFRNGSAKDIAESIEELLDRERADTFREIITELVTKEGGYVGQVVVSLYTKNKLEPLFIFSIDRIGVELTTELWRCLNHCHVHPDVGKLLRLAGLSDTYKSSPLVTMILSGGNESALMRLLSLHLDRSNQTVVAILKDACEVRPLRSVAKIVAQVIGRDASRAEIGALLMEEIAIENDASITESLAQCLAQYLPSEKEFDHLIRVARAKELHNASRILEQSKDSSREQQAIQALKAMHDLGNAKEFQLAVSHLASVKGVEYFYDLIKWFGSEGEVFFAARLVFEIIAGNFVGESELVQRLLHENSGMTLTYLYFHYLKEGRSIESLNLCILSRANLTEPVSPLADVSAAEFFSAVHSATEYCAKAGIVDQHDWVRKLELTMSSQFGSRWKGLATQSSVGRGLA